MRVLLFAVALVTSIASSAFADPQKEALLVIERWAKAFSESDVDGIVKLYSTDALFLGTGSKTVEVTPEQIRKYFENALLNNRPRGAALGERSIMTLSDTVVIVTGLDTVTGVRDGTPFSNSGRVTFVIGKRGDDWKILHFHRSAMPQ
jgi:uncharacterized protein (TIGR02246 family)